MSTGNNFFFFYLFYLSSCILFHCSLVIPATERLKTNIWEDRWNIFRCYHKLKCDSSFKFPLSSLKMVLNVSNALRSRWSSVVKRRDKSFLKINLCIIVSEHKLFFFPTDLQTEQKKNKNKDKNEAVQNVEERLENMQRIKWDSSC